MTTWYVDPVNGNDTNYGNSPANAIKTLTRLNNLMQAGDIAYLKVGAYRADTHGRFVPENSAGTADNQKMQLIGDKDGTIFGTAPGEVVFDGLDDVTYARAIDLGTTWTGKLEIKNIRFTRFKLNQGNVAPAVGGVIYSDNSAAVVQIVLENCVMDGLNTGGTGAKADGLAVFMRFSHADSHLVINNCTINAITSNAVLLTLRSSLTSVQLGKLKPHADIQNTTFGTDAGNTTAQPDLLNVNYFLSSNSFPDTGILRVRFKNVKARKSDGSAIGHLVERACGSIRIVFQDCYLNGNSIAAVSNNIAGQSARSLRFERCHLRLAGLNSATGGAGVLMDMDTCRVDITANVSVNSSTSIVAKDTFFKGESQPNLTMNQSGSFSFDNCVFSGFAVIQMGATQAFHTFNRCLLVNVGKNSGGAAQNGVWQNVFLARITNCVVLKAESNSLAYINTTTSDYAVLNNIQSNKTGISGVTSFTVGQAHIQAITDLQDRSPLLPRLVVPEMSNPLSGAGSAYVPVPTVGMGSLKMVLEGGRPNTITLTVKKSWTGGKLEFWMEDTLLGPATDTTAPQTLNLTFTPPKTGVYELEIFGYDGNVQTTTTTPTYEPNYILIDSVMVT